MLEIVFRSELAFGPCIASKEILFDIFFILALYKSTFAMLFHRFQLVFVLKIAA